MASPGELVSCIAKALKIPEPTVVLYDRLLAENGLRSKGGRGRSAAKVTPLDAANLLIALLGSPVAGASIKPASDVCEAYGRLPLKDGGSPENLDAFKRLGFPTLSRLSRTHTLREGIAAMIAAASAGEELILTFPVPPRLGRLLSPSGPLPDGVAVTPDGIGVAGPANDLFVSIALEGPTPRAKILVDAGHASREASFVYHSLRRDRDGAYWLPAGAGDLHQFRYVTFKTIRQIGKLLARSAEASA